VLEAGPALLRRIEAALHLAPFGHALAAVLLEAPIPDASKHLAIGMNYQDHAEEARRAGVPIPKTQLWFNKQVSCINGPFDAVLIPLVSDKVDYEIELGVVIGQRCRYVSEEDARSVVGGYFVVNDVTARDWQQASPTFTLGRSFDTHGPIGPWIVTPHPLLSVSQDGTYSEQKTRFKIKIFGRTKSITSGDLRAIDTLFKQSFAHRGRRSATSR